ALAEIPPLTIALGRVAVGAAVLLVLLRLAGEPFPLDRRLGRRLTLMALLNNVIPFGLILWGQLFVTAGLAAPPTATAPLFAVGVAHVATEDEKITPARLIGLAAGFVGVVVLIGPEVLTGLTSAVLGPLAVLLGAFFYAASSVYGRGFRAERPLARATGQTVA